MGNRARLIILIHASETIWVHRKGSSSKITNISPSVPTGEKDLDKYTGQLCCCAESAENTEMCR